MTSSHIDNMEHNSNTNTFNTLSTCWSLWAHLPQNPDWTEKGYEFVHKFKTVEDTIAITETLPELLVKNCMLFIMRESILPMWEDVKNRNGGCFSYKVSNKFICDVWRDLTYILIGNTLVVNKDILKHINGITVSPKKNFCIIKIWMATCDYQNPSIITSEIPLLSAQGCLFKKHSPEF